jgi:C1A family cysteine protease
MKKYHWLRDTLDQRDHDYKNMGVVRPSRNDLSELCSKIENQSTLGSCTGNAIVGGMEYLENKEKQIMVDLSRLFVYFNERAMEGTIFHDAGAQIRDGIKSVVLQGVCSEALWPYDITKFKKKPTLKCYKDGLTRKVTSYQRLNTLDDMLDCLAAGYPFVFGFSVYESFETKAVAKTGLVPMPGKTEKCLGGHAVLCVGYDDKTRLVKVRNSWGEEWGDKGYFYLPYDYISNRRLANDFWTIRK